MKALVDCNNFFVSCERVFDPALRYRPVAVLSSNDGCIIARSNEVKELGVPMGAPLFKFAPLLKRHGVVLKSSNFSLYADMSRRVMATLRQYAPDLEVYSIDEAFVELTDGGSYVAWADSLRCKIARDTGIPVSVGVAPSRTLAKAAATLAKSRQGSLSFPDLQVAERDEYMGSLPVDKVWGIGRKLTKQLNSYQVRTAYDLQHVPDKVLRRFSVSVRRTVLELRGVDTNQNNDEYSKSAISSRSFNSPVTDRSDLLEALSMHAAGCAAKLRREGVATPLVAAFISTGNNGELLHARLKLETATNDTRELTGAVAKLLPQIYRPGLHYKKAGVMVYRLVPDHARQLALGSDVELLRTGQKLDGALDEINNKWGPHTLKLATEGFNHTWQPKHALRSPRYTTEWSEIKAIS